MTPAAFGFGAGVFFIGYVLLEIPCAVLVETWSARKLLARIMVSWGILAACTAFVQTPTQFYVVRFLLGMAEAGFFPGVIVYLSNWYREEDRAKAVAMFMAAIPVSELLGAPISGLLMQLNWLGWSGWRWMLLLEGLPAVVLGVITLFYLTDRPEDAKWLPDDERELVEGRVGEQREEGFARAFGQYLGGVVESSGAAADGGVLHVDERQLRVDDVAAEDPEDAFGRDHSGGDSDDSDSVSSCGARKSHGRFSFGFDGRAEVAWIACGTCRGTRFGAAAVQSLDRCHDRLLCDRGGWQRLCQGAVLGDRDGGAQR
jgi:hypothetical protein